MKKFRKLTEAGKISKSKARKSLSSTNVNWGVISTGVLSSIGSGSRGQGETFGGWPTGVRKYEILNFEMVGMSSEAFKQKYILGNKKIEF